MGEIDTKSIEPVQVALSLFEEKTDQRKSRPTSSDLELEKEHELEGLLKDLANYKVQLEAKDSAHMQALLKLDHSRKTADALSTSLNNSEVERDKYMNECVEYRAQIDELVNKMKILADDQLLETEKIREQLSCALGELKTAKEELLWVETELAQARESEFKAVTQAEQMETAVNMERGKTYELLSRISELNEAILHSNLVASEAEKVNATVLNEKEAELQLVTTTLAQAHEQLEELRKQREIVQFLENELLAKSVFIETLQFELKEANELQSLSEKTASDAIHNLNLLKSDLESQEMELEQLKKELKIANDEVGRLNCDVGMVTRELEVDDIRGREKEAQVEVALVKSELHKGRSKIAAAEAAEVRGESVKCGVYLAVEAEEGKKESRRAKQAAADDDEMKGEIVSVKPQLEEEEEEEEEVPQTRYRKDHEHITISLMEYESLISKGKKEADQSPELVLKELEFATGRICELRTRAEQAVSRAEMAEKAKAAVEEQLRQWREQRQRRRAALAALREESVRKENNNILKFPATYQPLGKVLNMEFK